MLVLMGLSTQDRRVVHTRQEVMLPPLLLCRSSAIIELARDGELIELQERPGPRIKPPAGAALSSSVHTPLLLILSSRTLISVVSLALPFSSRSFVRVALHRALHIKQLSVKKLSRPQHGDRTCPPEEQTASRLPCHHQPSVYLVPLPSFGLTLWLVPFLTS